MSTRTGSCLCGAVSLTAKIEDPTLGACHCTQCQRWTGGGPLISFAVASIRFDSETAIREFPVSEWGVRANCKTCGSPLYWRMTDGPIKYITVGVLDDQSDLRLTEEIFVDYRPCWLHPVPEATQSTEAEQHALLQEYLDGKSKT